MNKIKRISSIILALLIVSGIALISQVAVNAEQTTYQIKDNLDSIKVNGRYEILSNGITSDWSASGIEFNAICSGDVSMTYTNSGVIFFAAYVDGVRQSFRVGSTSSATDTTIKIAENLPQGEHHIKVVKLTENTNAKAVLTSITINGTFSPKPADKDTYIEFMGDSITSGYGVVTDSTTISVQDSYHQDVTQTYAYLTAQNFNGDSSFVNVSGMGLSAGFASYKLPDIYEYVSRPRNSTLYEFTRTPDVIVINIGTNDANRTADVSNFILAVKSFVATVRSHNNNVPIVWCYNMMNANYRTHIESALNELGGETNKLYLARLAQKTSSAAGGHPTADGHVASANLLSAFLVEKGILPESKLSSTATASLSLLNVADPIIYNGDYTSSTVISGVGINSSSFTYSPTDGIATNSADTNALKITSSGAFASKVPIYFNSSLIKPKMANSYGIRFYINYIGEIEKLVNISYSDKNCTLPFNAEEGVTTSVDIRWEDIGGNAANEHLASQLMAGNINQIKFNFGSGIYTATVDDFQILYNKYSVTNNPNSSYEVPTTAQPVTTSPVPGISTTYLAPDCNPTGSPTPISGDVSGTIYVYNSSVAVGDYVTFTIPNVEAGTYSLYSTYRSYTGRAKFQTNVNGVDIGSPFDLNGDLNVKFTAPMNVTFTTTNKGNVTIKLTATAAGSYYFYSFSLQQTDVANTTTVTSTTASTTATQATTPTTALTTATQTAPTTALTTASTTNAPTTSLTQPTTQKTIYGDANDDGIVTAKDSLLLRQYIAEWDVSVNKKAADVSGDGVINSKDTLKLRKFLAAIITSLDPNS